MTDYGTCLMFGKWQRITDHKFKTRPKSDSREYFQNIPSDVVNVFLQLLIVGSVPYFHGGRQVDYFVVVLCYENDITMHTLPRLRDKISEYEPSHQRQGSDPLLTAQGKKHGTHSRLHAQIERELRLRMGAENLYKATDNKKLQETVAHELGCVNSNLQLLKEELANLSSSVNICQDFNAIKNVPMIPLGLKETKDVNMKGMLREYIKEHYHEDSQGYNQQLQQITELRQAVQTPVRNRSGVELLVDYYCQLYFIDKRFFPPNSHQDIQFEWFDSLTGVPSAQRTIGFEKGSILFNIGALETQIAARQDRSCRDGTDSAAKSFQKSAGAFKYLSENFSHAPSVDMQPPTLAMLIQLMLVSCMQPPTLAMLIQLMLVSCIQPPTLAMLIQLMLVSCVQPPTLAMLIQLMLVSCIQPPTLAMLIQLMLSQAQECLFEGIQLVGVHGHQQQHCNIAHEAAKVSSEYKETHTQMLASPVRDHIPAAWLNMVSVKTHYFRALAHYHSALAVAGRAESVDILAEQFSSLHAQENGTSRPHCSLCNVLHKDDDRRMFIRGHLRSAILALEDALRLHKSCKQLRRIDTLQNMLKRAHDRTYTFWKCHHVNACNTCVSSIIGEHRIHRKSCDK
ncbi:hypothetical protein LSAT2_023545 [Lamellibrachia satsuma]|nr:hypothetical protein LSAT2_023545 [Lamellibrachia satsuma]